MITLLTHNRLSAQFRKKGKGTEIVRELWPVLLESMSVQKSDSYSTKSYIPFFNPFESQRMRNFHGGKEEVNHPLDLFGAITMEAKRYCNQ